MFGSPMEDRRVVGSGSPPRENGKVDREIGLPPVLAAAANSRYIGQYSEAPLREIIEGRVRYVEYFRDSDAYRDKGRIRRERKKERERYYCLLDFPQFREFPSELFSSCWN